MATELPSIKGYPVLEANVLKARMTGRIWSQYELDETDFNSAKAYNGMVLAIDDVTKSVKFPVASTTSEEVYALHYSPEAEYEHKGLNTFAVAREPIQSEPNVSVHYPRMFELSVGDTFHTNCVALEDSNVSSINTAGDDSSLKALIEDDSTIVYGGVCPEGYILLDTSAPTVGPVFKATEFSTLPNGDWAVKLVVTKA